MQHWEVVAFFLAANIPKAPPGTVSLTPMHHSGASLL